MLAYRSHKFHSGALPLLVLTVHLLLIVPALSDADSVEPAKGELHLSDLEPKMKMVAGSLNGNEAGPLLARSESHRRNQRSIGFRNKFITISRSKLPIELELLLDNEEAERPKRYDNYGHMRFGKRDGDDQIDDYGHMRFGKRDGDDQIDDYGHMRFGR